MGDWDFDNDATSGGFDEPESAQKGNKASASGGLHVPLTLVCLVAVAAVSFGVAYLMKDKVRSFWEMGLTFAAPFAALMASALLVEFKTGRMTPACSRKAQLAFAAGTIVAAFVFGCLAEVLHQPVVIEHVEPEYDYVIVLDKSGSMVFTDLDEPCQKALHTMLDDMEDECRVGIVAFSDSLMGSQEIAPLDAEQRAAIGKVIDTKIPIETMRDGSQTGPGTDFDIATNTAMALVDKLGDRSRTMRIILVTDGDSQSEGNFNAFTDWAKKQNEANPEQTQVELCEIQLGDPMLGMVKRAVEATDGKVFDQTDPSRLAKELLSLKNTLIIPESVDTLKATYQGMTANGKPNTPYVILTAALLLLLGLLCGFSLMIMFSLHGQFRVQVVLSALMGVCAFLLLNYGRHLSISPAWICEGIAFSLFGLVFMRENGIGGSKAPKTPKAAKAAQPAADAFGDTDDF